MRASRRGTESQHHIKEQQHTKTCTTCTEYYVRLFFLRPSSSLILPLVSFLLLLPPSSSFATRTWNTLISSKKVAIHFPSPVSRNFSTTFDVAPFATAGKEEEEEERYPCM